jgi:hypothetical protein
VGLFYWEKILPLPKPKKNESKKDFLSRCMGNDVMASEYPDEKQRYAVCNSIWKKEKKSKEENSMSIKLNSKGNSHAKKLIKAGKVDKSSSWSFSADDGNKILGDDNWSEYAKWHLAIDTSKDSDTKAHYKYPFGKNGKVYRSALIAIRQRAGQQKVNDVFEAAGKLIDMIDGEKDSLSNDVEYRTFPVTDIEIRKDDDAKPKLVGYAAVFNSLSEDLGGFREKIEPGAFKKTIKDADVRALWNHDSNYVLGRTKSGTLSLKEDDKGLYIEIDPPDTQWSRDLMASIKRKDVDQMSFGFRTIIDEWEEKGKENIRTLKEVELFDVSPVTWPGYPKTNVKVALRSLEEWRAENNDLPEEPTLVGKQEKESEPTPRISILRRKLELKTKTMN